MRKVLMAFVMVTLGIAVLTAAETSTEHAADTAAINAVLTDRFLAGWNCSPIPFG